MSEIVRHYKRKTQRGEYGSGRLADALQAVSEGTALIRVSKEDGIPARILRRHRDKKVNKPASSTLGGAQPILPTEVEKELHDHIKYMERCMYGLKTQDVRRLAFKIAEKTGVQHPFNQETRKAGVDWLQGFFSRNQDLSI